MIINSLNNNDALNWFYVLNKNGSALGGLAGNRLNK